MRRRHLSIGLAILIAAAALAILFWPRHHHPVTHKATCWTPAYAATHTLHNETTFENGGGRDLPKGSRHGATSHFGADVCDVVAK